MVSIRRSMAIQKSYSLMAENMLVGKLLYLQGKTTALAQIAEGSWFIRNTSQVNPHVSIWTKNHEFVAMFEVNRIGSGNLLIQDGRRLKWEKVKQMPEEWYFSNNIGERIIKFTPEVGDFRLRGTSLLYPESMTIPKIGLYVLLGWFTLLVLEKNRNLKQITEKYTPW